MPVAPPPARTVSATSTYKYLGDVFISSQPPAAAREAFVSRLVRKLTLTLTRLFSYNRVTLRLCVATKMQLLGAYANDWSDVLPTRRTPPHCC